MNCTRADILRGHFKPINSESAPRRLETNLLHLGGKTPLKKITDAIIHLLDQ